MLTIVTLFKINYNVSCSSLAKCFSFSYKTAKSKCHIKCICGLNVELLTNSKEEAKNKLQTSTNEGTKSPLRHSLVKYIVTSYFQGIYNFEEI